MSRIPQEMAMKGSQKWLQILVNRDRDLLDDLLRTRLQLSAHDTITWLSPLVEDSYAEYQDEDFLELLSVRLKNRGLSSFWPCGGPVWDGLARTSRGDIILVEAKSHATELASSCKANPQSLKLIQDSLAKTAAFYGSTSWTNWLQGYYQYANRLAHLYLLRHLNGLQAWLIFLYFINAWEMAGPKSVRDWLSAVETVHAHLGIQPGRLEPNVVDLFIDSTTFHCVSETEK
jgi:hypothetical protein